MAFDKRITESFNNMKNRIYKSGNFHDKYNFDELVTILNNENLSKDELEILKLFKKYISNIKDIVEDIGTKICDLQKLDFYNKIRVEEFIREIILLIDGFIDALNAIGDVIEFEDNRINMITSLARLKSLRQSLIQKMVEYNRITAGINFSNDQSNMIQVLIVDIIDSIIIETFKLRILKLYEILSKKVVE